MKKIYLGVIATLLLSGCSSKTEIVEVETTKPVISTTKVDIPTIKQESSFEVTKNACLAGNASACYDLGIYYYNANDKKMAKVAFYEAMQYGDNRSYSAIRRLECEEGDGKSCGLLGWDFEQGEYIAQDYRAAAYYYQKAIDLGDTNRYGSLARLYDKGQGVKQDYFKAAKLYEKSCKYNSDAGVRDEACYNLGNMYGQGQGVKQNHFKAVELYRKSCNNNYYAACTNLGWCYIYGKGVRQSTSMAQSLFGKACDGGNNMGCENYAKNNR